MATVYVLQHIYCEAPGIISELQTIGGKVFGRWVKSLKSI
jgi:hypothetical protein